MTEVTIERLGHLGDGVAPGPIFVSGALPGEVVEGNVDGQRLINPKIITPSSDRVRPPCRHAKACGGCDLQHASDGFVERFKAGVVWTALAAHGLDAEIAQIHTSPPSSRRRATLSGRRTKKSAIVGFHGRASDTIVEVPGCKILRPQLMAAIPALQALTKIGASRKGEIRFTMFESRNGVDVSAEGGIEPDAVLQAEMASLSGQNSLTRLSWNGELIASHLPSVLRFGSADVVPPPGGFLQATQEGEAALVSAVLETVQGKNTVLDLFSGCGTFSLPIALTAEVHAVEGEAALLSALDAGWRQAKGVKKVSTETRDLFRRPLLPDELNAYDAAVIDPPRAGAEAQIAEIAKSNLSTLAMVSCNPVTFARDAKTLADAGFQLADLHVIDQFRWSPHVELAAAFRR